MMPEKTKNNLILAMTLAMIFVVAIVGFFIKHSANAAGNNSGVIRNIKIDGSILPQAKVLADFTLEGIDSKPFTKSSLKGHWSLMFFGFTNCPFVCPTTMSEIAKMYQMLQKKLPTEKLPTVIFVTVDPERDSIARLKGYVTKFNAKFQAARGELPALNQLVNQLGVASSKVLSSDAKPTDYMVVHSSQIFVLDPDGNLRAILSYPHKAKRLAKDYKAILGAVSAQGAAAK